MRASPALAVLAALAGALAFWWLRDDGGANRQAFVPGVRAVVAARAEPRELEEHIEALGTTHSWESIELRPAVTEVVSAVHFEDGQQVRRGDLLVTLVQDEERARLAEARAQLAEHEREVRRIEGLVASRSLPGNQLDERRTLRDVALARVAAAEAALADREIRAPFDGVLGLRGPSPGALVTPETVISTLDDVAALRLDFAVASTWLGRLRIGSPVEATTAAMPGKRYGGVVTGIDSRVNPVDRSVRVRARIDNVALELKPGLLMQVDLVTERRQGLVIPESAVIHYQDDHSVLRVDAADGNRVASLPVEIGIRIPGFVEVKSGLAEGDLVVTEGLTSVRPGEQVELREADAPR